MSNIFQHTMVPVPEGGFKISPSQISKFFDLPSIWYKENVLNEEPSFKGNTASFTGTCCHKIYEMYANNPAYFVQNKEEMFNYVDNQLQEHFRNNPEIAELCDLDTILTNYPQIAKAVINEYLIQELPSYTELAVCTNVNNYKDFYVSGSVDNVTNHTVVDYKNVSVKPTNLTEIPFYYKIQLLAYRYALKKELGIETDQIRIVYGVAPTKTLPARCFVVTETVTNEDEELIENTLQLMCESLIRCNEDPSLVPLIFKSMKLQGE